VLTLADQQHLSLAFEEAFRVGEKLVNVEVIEAVLSRQIDLEPKLMRHECVPIALRDVPRGHRRRMPWHSIPIALAAGGAV
jgi:hypothetical protein